MNPAADANAPAAPSRVMPVVFLLAGIGTVGVLLFATSGGLGYRSVAEMSDAVPMGQDTDCVRIEIQNGTVGVDIPAGVGQERTATYAGGVRRAANSAEELARLEQIPFKLVATMDPGRPHTLVLRGPSLPAGSADLMALELGVRLPADLAVEVVIAGSGHVTVANRTGRTLAETGRGDLRFERCRGAVTAKTGRGMVIAFDHCGDLDIKTVVGDMQAFVEQPGRLLRLVSGQGSVQCGVPETCEFDLDARAEVGRIGADFGLTATTVGSYGAVLTATRGAATTRVVLRTGSGHLSFRAKQFH